MRSRRNAIYFTNKNVLKRNRMLRYKRKKLFALIYFASCLRNYLHHIKHFWLRHGIKFHMKSFILCKNIRFSSYKRQVDFLVV